MTAHNKISSAIISVSMLIASMVFPLTANATTFACTEAGKTITAIESRREKFTPLDSTVFTSGPGGTISASKYFSKSMNLTITGSTTVGISVADIVNANMQAGISTGATVQVADTFTYSHNIPANRIGHLQFGNWSLEETVVKQKVASNCSVKIIARTTAKVPRKGTAYFGYRYWDTAA